MSIHIVLDDNLSAGYVNMPQQLNLNGEDAANPIPTELSQREKFLQVNSSASLSFVGPAVSSNNVDNIPYHFNALTNQAIEQHQHHHDATAHGAQPIQPIESFFAYPYQRYNGYNPIVAQANDAVQVRAVGTQRVDALSYANTMSTMRSPSYTGTSSNLPSMSYNSTSLDTYLSSSSVQAQPEYEQYTHAQHNDQGDGYWQTQSIGYGVEDSKQDLAGVGAQFSDAK